MARSDLLEIQYFLFYQSFIYKSITVSYNSNVNDIVQFITCFIVVYMYVLMYNDETIIKEYTCILLINMITKHSLCFLHLS